MSISVKTRNDTKLQRGASLMLLGGVFLTSLSVLALEITFARILSVMLSYHYVFIAISIALLGLGGGGIFVYFVSKTKKTGGSFGSLARFAGLFSLSTVISLITVIKIPYTDNIVFYSFMMLLPFFFAGVVLSQAFQMFAQQSGKIYGADLLGAAGGALLVIPILNSLGAVNSGFLIALVAATACLFFTVKALKRRTWLFSVANLSLVIIILLASIAIPKFGNVVVGENTAKELSDALNENSQQGTIVESRWSSFGRTDLVQFDKNPDVMAIYADATAGTPMYKFSGDINNPGVAIESLKATFPGYFPFQSLDTSQKDNALIIGPGGGRDILLALMGGIKQITAIEVNGDSVNLVKKYSSYNGGIYTNFPNINVVVGEGRNFLRQQKDRFDIIMLSLPVTKTSRSPEGFALTENFLFTRESIGDYLDHLTDEGQLIVVTHGEVEVLRLLSLSISVFEERGVDNKIAMNYIYTVGSHHNSLFVLSKSQLKPKESLLKHKAIHLSSFEPQGSYFPYVKLSSNKVHVEQDRFDECQMLDPALIAMSSGGITLDKVIQVVAGNGYNIGVVTDNRPFFYNFEQGVPGSLLLAFWLALILVTASVSIPYLVLRNKQTNKHTQSSFRGRSFIIIFFMLGLGFMLVEVPLIQKFTLFLGEPILSVTVLLFSILIGAGLGGLFSGRLPSRSILRNLSVVPLVIAFLVPAYALLTPPVFSQLLGWSLTMRALVSAALLIPLGFLLGFPFPLSIRLLKELNLEHNIPWMWGINGAASVLGSVTAIVVAMMFGLNQALLVGAACYFVASLVFKGRVERRKKLDNPSDLIQ